MLETTPIADDQLVLRIADGDAAALEVLYERYVRQCFGLALRMLGESGQAEEVVQEVFIKVWKQPDSYTPTKGKFVSWILSLVHHRCIDQLRKKSRTEVALEDPATGDVLATSPDGGLDPGDQVVVFEQQRAVRAALGQIADSQRQVLELAYFGGLSQSEIATKLNQPLGTVKTRMRLGMQNLKNLLADYAVLRE